MSTGKVVLGTLAGLAIGAIAGILFAPEKGSKTRKQLLDKGGDYADGLKTKFDDFYEKLSEMFDKSKEETESLIMKGKSKITDTKNEIKHVASEV